MAQRQTNRQLGTQALLALVRTQAPALYDIAQIVGKWVWMPFREKQPAEITSQLA